MLRTSGPVGEDGLYDMSDCLVAIVLCLAFCVALGTFTNLAFGHATFFRCYSGATARPALVPAVDVCKTKSTATGRCKEESTPDVGRRGEGGHNIAIAISASITECSAFFSDAPISVLESIGFFLCPAELVDTTAVSVDFRRAVSESGVVWREHCCRVFGGGVLKKGYRSSASILGEGWREETLRRCADSALEGDGEKLKEPLAGVIDKLERDSADSPTQAIVYRRVATFTRPSFNLDPGHCVGIDQTSHCSMYNGGDDDCHCSTSVEQRQRLLPLSSSKSPLSRPPAFSSWKAAFFHAHRSRPNQMLEEGKRLANNYADESSFSSCLLVVVGGKVHDLAGFLNSHPGGALILQEHAFTDATHAFERFFHSREARRIARDFVVWDGVDIMGRSGTLWRYSNECRRNLRVAGGKGGMGYRGANAFHQAISRWTTDR